MVGPILIMDIIIILDIMVIMDMGTPILIIIITIMYPTIEDEEILITEERKHEDVQMMRHVEIHIAVPKILVELTETM